MGESFGAATIVFGALYAIASLLLLRGNRLGFYGTVILSVLGLVAGVIYLFRAENAILFGTLLAGALNALVLYLLLGTKSAREYFAR
jgi:uncharacterized membrane protein (UPF0136 family)